MNINPGELRNKIEIFEYVTAYDADRFPTQTESTVRECYAKVWNTSGMELIRSGADFTTTHTRFLIRKSSTALNKSMFIKFRNDIYNITYINEYNFSREYIEIWADLKELSVDG